MVYTIYCSVVSVNVILFTNPLPAILSNLIFHPLEVVSATTTHNFKWVGVTQIFFNLRPNICKSCCLGTHFIPNHHDNSDRICWQME